MLALFVAMLLAIPWGGTIAQEPPQEDEFVEDTGAPAEEEEAAALPLLAGEQIMRITFFSVDQMAYITHPFFQITGDNDFRGGQAGNSAFGIMEAATDKNESTLIKAFHTIPALGFETGQNLEFFFPKAATVGFDYVRISQTDKESLDTTKKIVTIPRITMDTYYYAIYAKAYAFNLTEPGLNYFIGSGLALIQGSFLAIPFEGASEKRIEFGQSPVGFTQLGLEILGDGFGVRYELRLVNAKKVRLSRNPYLDQASATKIDFSGSMVRLSVFYQF